MMKAPSVTSAKSMCVIAASKQNMRAERIASSVPPTLGFLCRVRLEGIRLPSSGSKVVTVELFDKPVKIV